ncbi:MAG: phosphatase PAP2 family protein [Alphaproteobacteria bacterium]|nr:phosphatase PAP2 family protein [Alphaproteobacteria bacterium]
MESLLLMLIFILLLLVFCFLMATLKYPFVDSTLVFIDSIFGINSSAVVLWFRTHELLNYIFSSIYKTYFYQIPLIIVYFSIRGDALALQRFVMQFIIALILTIIISGFLPALGPYVWYNYQPSPTLAAALAQLLELREGILDFSHKNGVVSLPSFHTVAAFLYMYTFRNENKVLFVSIVILNTLMVFSCIPIGEHYFADILGAIPTFLVAIWIDFLIYKHIVHVWTCRASQEIF